MQNDFLRLLIELNVCLILGYVLYYCLFRKNDRHAWNRIFLIAWPLLSLVIAMTQINWTVWKAADPEQLIRPESITEIPSFNLEEIMVTSIRIDAPTEVTAVEEQLTLSTFWQQNWHFFYWAGAFILALTFLFRLAQLRYLINQATQIRRGQYTLLEHPKLQSIFSFGSYIFNPKGQEIDPMILEHELVHIRQKHSLDLLWMELLVIFCWFNPVIYLYRKKLKETHEFIADQSVVKQFGLLAYARLLVKQATLQKIPALVTPFAAFTKKRILTMKTKSNNPWSRLRYGLILPLFLILLTAFAIKRVERQRPAVTKAEAIAVVDSQVAAQIKWGDLTCNCFEGELKGSYLCDINTVSKTKLVELSQQVPNITMKNEEASLLVSAKQYSATIFNANQRKVGTPVEFSEGFFAPTDKFWKKLNPGDKVKFRAILGDGKALEFPVALEGTHPKNIVKSYLKNSNGLTISFDPISFKAQVDMSVEEFRQFANTPLSIIQNGKKFEGPVSLNSMQAFQGELGSYYTTEASSDKDNYIVLAEHDLFRDISPGEFIILQFTVQDILFGTGKSNESTLRINLKGPHPIYQQNPSIEWGGMQVEGTTITVKLEDIPKLKNTLPTLKINGKEFINPNQALRIKEYIRGPNFELKAAKMKSFPAQDFQTLINHRLNHYESWLDRSKKASYKPYIRTPQISIPTPDGNYFNFVIEVEEYPSMFDMMHRSRSKGFNPSFSIPLKDDKIESKSSGYGQKIHPITKKQQLHRGIDFTAPLGTKVKASAKGIVVKVERNTTGYGNKIVIKHAYGYQTVYGQLQSIAVKEGEQVARGQHIGTVGSTGQATRPHLHFEILENGKAIDPEPFFAAWKK